MSRLSNPSSRVILLLLACAIALTSQQESRYLGRQATRQALQRDATGERTLVLDPTSTKVGFAVGTTFGTVTGSFGVQSGVIHWNLKTGEASGRIVINAVSGGTGTHWEDAILQNDVLRSRQYPRITYRPTRVRGGLVTEGSTEFYMEGILHLQNADHAVSMEITVDAAGQQIWAAAHVILPYTAWGLREPRWWFIHADPTVSLDISTTGIIQNETGPRLLP